MPSQLPQPICLWQKSFGVVTQLSSLRIPYYTMFLLIKTVYSVYAVILYNENLKFLFGITFGFFWLATISLQSQEIWYSFTMEGDLKSLTHFENKLIINSLVGTETDKGTSEISLVNKLDSIHFIAYNENKKPNYALISMNKSKNMLTLTTLVTAETKQKTKLAYDEGNFPVWKILTGQDWYSKEKIEILEKAPGLDELKREDLLLAMQWRAPLGKLLQKYLEDMEGKRSFMVYRFVENYRNQRNIIDLGYNPYKRVTYNLFKQFENDEEIMPTFE